MEAVLNRRLMEMIRNMDADGIADLIKEYRGNYKFDLSEALCLGARTAHVETVRTLLKMKADVTYTDRDGRRALHYAADMGSVGIVKSILNAGSPVNVADTHGATALHYAAESGHTDTLLLLLTEGANVNRARLYHTGETPLHLACKSGRTEICKLLIARGADVNSVTSDEFQTPLHLATRSRSLFTVRLLCELRADVNRADVKGRSPLQYAVECCSVEIVEELLNHGANSSARDKRGQTPLHVLAGVISGGSSQAKIAELLIEYTQDINSRDAEGLTPLHMAALVGNADVAAMMVTGGAAVNIQEHARGETPLNMAVAHNRAEVVRLLIALDADVNMSDNSLVTPLHNVMGSRSAEKAEMAELLVRHGSKLNATTQRGHTPLDRCVFHFVIGNYNKEILKMLVVAGAYLRPVAMEGRPHRNSPLCWLTWHGEILSARFLVNAGWELKNEQWIFLPGKNAETDEFMESLRQIVRQPRSLWITCRNMIRDHLNRASDDRDITPLITQLPLPTFLKRHLMLEQEVRMLETGQAE